MKYLLFVFVVMFSAAFVLPDTTHAATEDAGSGFVPLAPISGLTEGIVADETGLANFLQNLYRYLIGVAVIVAIIQIIRGGLEISTESITKHDEGKKHIRQALFGLLLVLSPVIVFSIINPSILNLSIPLQNIKLSSGGGSNPQNQPTPSTDEATGCLVSGVSGFFQKAVCPSDTAANEWKEASCTTGKLVDGGCGGSNSSGCTQRTMYCQYESGDIILVDKNSSIGIFLSSYTFSPLAKNEAGTIEFQRFKNGCDSASANLCVRTHPNTWNANECEDYGGYTSTISGTSDTERCYERNLLCSNIGVTQQEGYCTPELQIDPTPFQ